MARPKKEIVDYFPHYVNHGKTMFCLENEFGNDGYAAWFKLLELLGRSPGHYYDINKTSELKYLSAIIGVSGEKTQDILGFLSELEAIDSELYKHGIIWSDNFVENLRSVYDKRNGTIPVKPYIRTENHSFRDENNSDLEFPAQPESETPQSKVKYSKVETTLSSAVSPDKFKSQKKEQSNLPKTEQEKIAQYMAEEILRRDPNYSQLCNGKTPETVNRWSKDIEKLHRIDKRPWEQIRSVVEWCLGDNFWQKNILSGSKLRKQFDQLVLKMPAPNSSANDQDVPDFMQGVK